MKKHYFNIQEVSTKEKMKLAWKKRKQKNNNKKL